MKNKFLNFAAVLLMVLMVSSFTSKRSVGTVTLDVNTISTMGGSATVLNTDTNTPYQINAIDTFGAEQVPYGNYVVVSASTTSCNPPLLSGVTTSTGYFDFVIDANNTDFTIYASCY
ncbi:MAG: hypothetical protein EOO89_32530 [Pedobacter sp.]|nr:MAG: hypothetical protein EOO89_32530 [Pedobacter sp.]